jgi:hypothetical protein
MQAPFIDEYEGYQLDCAPAALVGGGFAARLQIAHAYGAHRDDYTVDAGAGVFEAQVDAAAHARRVGRQWVDERAQAPRMMAAWPAG